MINDEKAFTNFSWTKFGIAAGGGAVAGGGTYVLCEIGLSALAANVFVNIALTPVTGTLNRMADNQDTDAWDLMADATIGAIAGAIAGKDISKYIDEGKFINFMRGTLSSPLGEYAVAGVKSGVKAGAQKWENMVYDLMRELERWNNWGR